MYFAKFLHLLSLFENDFYGYRDIFYITMSVCTCRPESSMKKHAISNF